MTFEIDSISEKDSAKKKREAMWEMLFERLNNTIEKGDLEEVDRLIMEIATLAFHEISQTSRLSSMMCVKDIEDYLINRLKNAYKPSAAMISLLAVQILAIPVGFGFGVAPYAVGAGNAATSALHAASQGAQQVGSTSSNASQIFSTIEQGKRDIIQAEIEREKTLKNDRSQNSMQEQQKKEQTLQQIDKTKELKHQTFSQQATGA